MLRSVKSLICLGLLGASAQLAFGFALEGPLNEAFQIPNNGFNTIGRIDIGGPKSLGQEYRRNTPIVYYAYTADFLDYFGAAGADAVDQAFAAFNVLTNVSAYSSDLSEIPLHTLQNNPLAETIGILDLKSYAMHTIAETMGLADPIRYMWNVRNRNIPAGGVCPFDVEYQVVQRNYDPAITSALTIPKPSSYVNGVLYTYGIQELCNTPPGGPLARTEAIEFAVDLDNDTRTVPVASGAFALWLSPPSLISGLLTGNFYTGLTRDDVGGWRYLLSQNNMNVESAGPGTIDFVTNNQPILLNTSSLTLFAAQAATNSAAALVALYPNLNIISTSNTFALVTNVTTFAFFTNSPWAPVGSPPQIGFFTITNITPTTFFVHTFGNVFTVGSRSNALAAVPLATIPPPNGTLVAISQNVVVTNTTSPQAPFGSVITVTNFSTPRIFATNAVVGDFFILPGTNCGVAIQSQLQATLAFNTVFTITTTNLANTNTVTGTNAPESFTQTVVTVVTNRVFIALPINCPADTPALREGVEKITFIRRDFDSLLGQFYDPITNQYYLNQITNNMVIGQRIQRIVTAPDFLITADNLPPEGDTSGNLLQNAYARGTTFTLDPGYAANAAGPGTIGNANFTLNRNTPIFINTGLTSTNNFLLQGSQLPWVVWGSFDGTTNPPFIYPTDLSLSVLEAQVLVQITPFYLPTGFVGNDYSAQMDSQNSGTYWIGPFTWSLAPNSPGLPPGLTIDQTGVISGIPTQAALYDIVIRATDSQGHTVDRAFTLDISQ